jgi:periplasmic copper chaperone A
VRNALIAAVLVVGTSPAFAQNARVGDIEIAHAWAPAMAAAELTNSAVYMSLADIGTKPDELVSASSPVAQKVELHVFGVENRIYGMHSVDAIEVSPGAAPTILRPGGAHVMLKGLNRPLKTGESFPLSLTFKNAGKVQIEVRVEGPQAALATGAN